MAENIISNTKKSSRIKKKLREDRTLIKEAENVKFVSDRNENNAFRSSNEPTE